MRRSVIAAVVFLLLGLLTSIAVAWVGMLVEYDELTEEFTTEDEQGWEALITATPWRISVDAQDAATLGTVPAYELDDWNLDQIDFPGWSETRRNAPHPYSRLREAASGWPMRCLRYARILKRPRWIEEWDFENRGALVGLTPWRKEASCPTDAVCLPLLPLAGGLALDTLFYAAISALPFAVVYIDMRQRATTRRREGLCPRCRYDLGHSDSDKCPECGAEPSYRPPLIGPRRLYCASIGLVLLLAAVLAFGLLFRILRPYPPLHYAAYMGDTDAIARLLARGADIDERMTYSHSFDSATVTGEFTFSGLKPLMLAASVSDVQTVRILLDSGADIDSMCDRGITALHYACGSMNHPVIDELIARGADVNAGAPRITPMWWAALNGDVAAMEKLAEAGADVVNDEKALAEAVRHGHRPFVEGLLRRGCVVTVHSLIPAVWRGRHDLLDLLLEHGGDLRQTTAEGSTLLFHLPPDPAHRPMWQRIIDAGVDVNAVHNNGGTALFLAAGGSPELVRFLLDHGADPTIRNAAGETALDQAWMFVDSAPNDIIRMLQQAIAEREQSEPEREDPG